MVFHILEAQTLPDSYDLTSFATCSHSIQNSPRSFCEEEVKSEYY